MGVFINNEYFKRLIIDKNFIDNINKDYFKTLSTEKHKNFTEKLNPNVSNIIGVRIPHLKIIAKKLADSDLCDLYLSKEFNYCYESIMLYGLTICFIKNKGFYEISLLLKNFIPYINSWSICDYICNYLKITKIYREEMLEFIMPYKDSKNIYEVRFFIVMLLYFYVDDNYIDFVFKVCNNISIRINEYKDNYYIKMALSWLICECFTKHQDKTTEYLKGNNLDKWTHNKSISKICDSLKVSDYTKENIKLYRR